MKTEYKGGIALWQLTFCPPHFLTSCGNRPLLANEAKRIELSPPQSSLGVKVKGYMLPWV
jgi:hypothetical protein